MRPLRFTAHFVHVVLSFVCMGSCSKGDDNTYDVLDAASPLNDASLGSDAVNQGDGDVSPMIDAVTDRPASAPNRCLVRAGGDIVVAERFFDPRSALSVAMHGSGALLSYSQYKGGKSLAHSSWFAVDAAPVDASSIDDGANQTDVYSCATREGFLTLFHEDTGALFARRTGSDGSSVDATPLPIATGVSSTSAVAATGADGRLLVAFADAIKGSALLLGADLTPVAALHEIPNFAATVGRPVLVAFGGGYLLAWIDAGVRRVHLQTLDAMGAPTSARLIDSDGEAQGNLDVATTETSGAVVWDVRIAGERAEVRFRAFGLDGVPTGIEQSLTPFPDSGLHPTAVATRGGFLVAYRSTEASSVALRMLLLDGRGKPVSSSNHTLRVASLVQQDLPLAMRMTSDGLNVFVAWLDQTLNASDYQLKQTWVGCD